MPITSILWRRLDQAGHDSARLNQGAAGAILEGTALFDEAGRPCKLDYRVVCDAQWRTVSARVTGWLDATGIDVEMAVDETRIWTFNGRTCPDVQGCADIDLSFSPATNLLPIRRARLVIGARADVRAAWFRFPDPTLESLSQTYERVAESRYRYESGTFVTMLETNAGGFVTHYPGRWQLERAGGPAPMLRR